MNTEKSVRFNSPPVVASVIIAAGLIIAAMIDSHKFIPQTAEAVHTQTPAATTLSEASVREQFVSQMNSEYKGTTEMLFGKMQTYNGTSIDKVQIATAGNKIDIDYELHWMPQNQEARNQNTGAVTATGCVLTKDNYGHFTNAYDIVTDKGAIKPQLDLQ